MFKHILALSAISAASPAVYCTEQTQPIPCDAVYSTAPTQPRRYDADLFRKDDEVVFASAEFLYWTAQESCLDYAVRPSSGGAYLTGNSQNASFDLSPGIRITGGYFNAPKYWEVKGQYTYLTTSGKNRANAPLVGLWPAEQPNSPLTHAHSTIDLKYNVFDVVVDRMFIPNPHLKVRMLAGISTAWLEQNWRTEYFSGAFSTVIRNNWHFVGGGLRAGITSDWYWGRDIYLTGLASVAALLGSYNSHYKQTTPGGLAKTSYSDTRPTSCIQFIAGPSLQKNFTNHRLEIFIGYELNIWSNLQEIRKPGKIAQNEASIWVANSLLALQGLTTRVSFDF